MNRTTNPKRYLSVKSILSSMILATASALAQTAAPEPTLKPGSEVKLEAVASAQWIQGEAPKSFEPGKVYMFECWATWCGPCVAAIPHVNELHKKYYDKGLRVYGMNVWEDGRDKVEKFVKGKGDGMSYPVAYTGKGSAFETEWLKAAGVRGIPHAFVVKDGKLLLTSHPSQLSDTVIELLLSGEDGARKAVSELNASKENQAKATQALIAFRKASNANDVETMTAKLDEYGKLAPNSPTIVSMKLDLLVARKDWDAATKMIDEMPDGTSKKMTLAMTAGKIGMQSEGGYPAAFIKSVAKGYTAMLSEPGMNSNPMGYVTLTNLNWRAGDKEAAVASAKKAAALAAEPHGGRSLPSEPFTRFAKSVEEGVLPEMKTFSSWLRGSMAAPAANVKPAPATPTPPTKPSAPTLETDP